jgi:hypothetical protein
MMTFKPTPLQQSLKKMAVSSAPYSVTTNIMEADSILYISWTY